ncbi:MAG TPA: asparagine synthase (glutamine-hydrolyzing) [Stellaceae bacterium]|nr:asparagine synthase (glutamine-hydrolyzing) [Stellaceae bacterium]
MCGVVAIYAYGRRAAPVDTADLIRIRDAMIHRGPDAEGVWLSDDRRVGLGHRRLAIIAVDASGNQPMRIVDTGTCITFNGEIYNFRELRRSLEQRGRVFRTDSDTEVLLQAYDEFGPRMVEHLRGMYAFAIWDPRKQGLFLARDPIGVKPLYYHDDGDTLHVASQVKALLKGDIDSAIDPAGCVSFFLLGYVAEPFTIRRGIKALPAGHTMWIDAAGASAPRPFFSIRDVLREAEEAGARANGAAPASDAFIVERIKQSVGAHMVADVPVGLFLSAGLDSTSLASLAAQYTNQPLRTVTLAFREYAGTDLDEAPIAEEVARAFRTEHRTERVQGSDFLAERAQVLAAMDQPSTDGVNTYFVSKAAARAGLKVALSGVGGDELFGGYPSYAQVPRLAHALGGFGAFPGFGRAVRAVSAGAIQHFASPKYAGLFEYGTSFEDAYLLRRALYMPWELPEVLDPDLVRAGWVALRPSISLGETIAGLGHDHTKVAALEMNWYMRNQLLRDTDWAGMAHSLEVRTPLVDGTLLTELAGVLAQDRVPSKREIAAATPVGRIDAVMARAKTGFTVPVRQWLLEGAGQTVGDRGLRGWAKLVFEHHANL